MTPDCSGVDPRLEGSLDHRFACIHPVPRADVATVPLGDPSASGARISTRARPTGPEPRSDDGEVLLQVDRLTRDYPVTKGAVLQRRVGAVSAVADVTFDVRRGTTFGLVGESGCGKSTLGRLIVGLDVPTSGTVRVAGVDHAELKGQRLKRSHRDVQLMFQDPFSSLDPRMRVGATLQEPLMIQGIGSRRQQRRTVVGLLDRVGLPEAAMHRYPHEFSGGQRQRIGLARALALNPSLVVADEPVSALDVSVQAQILNLLRDLQTGEDLTYVFISHDLSVVRYVSDVIAVMYLGKIVESGPAESVYVRPRHPYTRGLVDSVPVADPTSARPRAGITGELPSATEPPTGCRFRTRCPRAEQICSVEEPPLRPFGEDGHVAACHFPLDSLSMVL